MILAEPKRKITFPKHEHQAYKDALDRGEDVSTPRICKELDKYKVHLVYYTEWGEPLLVI